MKKRLVAFVIAGLFFCLNVVAEDRFVVIGDAEIPDLMETVQSLGAFAEKVQPGMQMLIVGSVLALNFDPNFAPFDMNSKLRCSLYGDSQDTKALPVFCGIAKYKKSQKLPKAIKLGKDYKLFVKPIGGKALIASSEKLLDDVEKIPKATKSESDLVIQLFPDKYLKKCPGNIANIRKFFQEKGKSPKEQVSGLNDEAIEKLLKQCDKMELKVNAEEKQLSLVLKVKPAAGMELAEFLNAAKPGEISSEKILKIAKKISGNNDFDVKKGLNGIISSLLVKIFDTDDSKPFDQLCDIKASYDKSNLILKGHISQVALRKALIASGVIRPNQNKNM